MSAHPRFALSLVLAFTLLYAIFAWFLVPTLTGPQADALARSNHLPPNLPQPAQTPAYAVRDIWLRFDTVWYLEIAHQGYQDPRAVVFYPLYPLLIRLLAPVLGPMNAALLVARAALFFLLWGLVALLALDLEDKIARLAAALLLLWPAGFMLCAAYPDALVLALSVWALYLARTDRWWPAALCAAAACTAKAAGAAVLLALALLAWRARPRPVWPVLAASLGVLIYPLSLHLAGLPQPSSVYPVYWLTRPAWPWDTLAAALRFAAGPGDFVATMDLLALAAVAAALFLWRARPEYLAYGSALLLLFLTKKTDPLLQSTMRYLTAVFPAFASFALHLRHPFLLLLLVFVSMLLHALFLAAFWRWSLVV